MLSRIMLVRRPPAPLGRHAGFTLIELLVALTLLALLLTLAAPSFAQWLANARIRTTADALMTDLQFAKSEAVRRNTLVRFQLVDTLDATCALTNSSTNWVINLDPGINGNAVVGLCASAASDTVAPFILRARVGAEGQSDTLQVTATGEGSFLFNGLGQAIRLGNGGQFDISAPLAGACAAAGGELNCLRVVVAPSGQIRSCNPRFAPPDARAC
jgi:type IV fimbrial biogenesis protein FimT